MKDIKWVLLAVAAPVLLALIIGCGGSASTGSSGSGGVISGTAVKGPVAGATVTAYSINGDGTMGGQIGSGTTDGQGNFSMSVGGYSGPVLLRMAGGRYIDEATGTDMPMGGVMTSAIPYMEAAALMDGVHITPLTSMAQAMSSNMQGGMTTANISNANGAMGRYYDITDIMFTHPIDPAISNSGIGADGSAVNYGMYMAAMSEYAKAVGMPYSSGMVAAMMEDASDGTIDGLMWGAGIALGGGMIGNSMLAPNAGTIGMADAMAAFLGSPYNMSGVTSQDMLGVMDNMRSSRGTIQNGMMGNGPGNMM